MMKNILHTILMLFIAGHLAAQVSNSCYTLSPVVHSVWLDTQAGLENSFLLDGQRTRQLSEFDKTCYKIAPGSFHGLRIPIEPSVARLNFHTALPYRNTWMGGAYAGLDFGPYVGFRGFYFKAMNDGKVKLDFDKLTLYGGELRLRLNVAQGLTSILLLGGGYLHVNDRYKPRNDAPARSQAFAQSGLGLNVPLSDRLHILGGVRAILTSDSGGSAQQSGAVHTSWMYNFGLKLTLRKKA